MGEWHTVHNIGDEELVMYKYAVPCTSPNIYLSQNHYTEWEMKPTNG